MKIQPTNDLTNALLAIESRTVKHAEISHSQQTKTPPHTSEDKENAYPCQSIPRFKTGVRRGLEMRAPPKPITPNPQEINPSPKELPRLSRHPIESTPNRAESAANIGTELPITSAPVIASTKKKHHARMARLLQRPMLGMCNFAQLVSLSLIGL